MLVQEFGLSKFQIEAAPRAAKDIGSVEMAANRYMVYGTEVLPSTDLIRPFTGLAKLTTVRMMRSKSAR